MLKDRLAAMPGRVKIDCRGCGEQQLADQKGFEIRYGVRLIKTRMDGMYSACTVELEDAETGERATVNGYHPPFELYIYPQQAA